MSVSLATAHLVVERLVNAPRARVWESWTDASHLARWWGPAGWSTTVVAYDLRPGGVWHYCMRAEDKGHAPVWGRADFVEVVPPRRLVFAEAGSDPTGAVVDPAPRTTVVEFHDRGDRTLLRVTTGFSTEAQKSAFEARGLRAGYSEALDRLEALVVAAGRPS